MHAKGLSATKALIGISGASLAFLTFTACGVDYEWGPHVPSYACDDITYSDYHSKRCVDWRCSVDAGLPEDNCPDAGSSEDGGSSARCTGTCVNNAPIGFSAPQPVYIGPPKAKYLFGCPPEVGAFAAPNQYHDLHVPSPGCPTCVCGSIKGTCSPPEKVTLRPTVCGAQASDTFDFSGPSGWDGSCTNFNAMPAGAQCPPGSGVACAQSIDAATLAPPVEACEPIPLPVPKLTSDKPWWTNTVMPCVSNALNGACDNAASEACLPSLPPGEPEWRYCVRQAGIHECPQGNGATFVHQYVAYDGFIDTRACTACECGASGGNCYGTLRTYADDACSTNEIVSYPVGSNMTNCLNLAPTGDSFGSKELTDVTYMPGACEPKGGEPIGDVVPIKSKIDENGKIVDTVTTWCCMPHAKSQSM